MYIELPVEDAKATPDMLGRLKLCLYGTRDDALNLQQTQVLPGALDIHQYFTTRHGMFGFLPTGT